MLCGRYRDENKGLDITDKIYILFNMIPKVRTWKVRVVETGEVYRLDTINKMMVKLIMRFEYPIHWGKTLKISLDNGR